MLATQYQGPSSAIPYTLMFTWATSVTSVTSVKAYKNGADVSGTVLSGSNSASGNSLTTKTVSTLTGGEEYILEIVAVVDGITDTWWMPVECLKAATGRK
jgi:hypothetical protein